MRWPQNIPRARLLLKKNIVYECRNPINVNRRMIEKRCQRGQKKTARAREPQVGRDPFPIRQLDINDAQSVVDGEARAGKLELEADAGELDDRHAEEAPGLAGRHPTAPLFLRKPRRIIWRNSTIFIPDNFLLKFPVVTREACIFFPVFEKRLLKQRNPS